MKKITLLFSVLYASFLFSQKSLFPKKMTQKGFGSLDYISVKMPNDQFNKPEINMGLAGIHYNLWLNKSIYGGLGFYGSIHGKRGGLFTLGFNAGVKTNIHKNIFLDTGFHFGGGGGASAPDGGGAFILPHINLGYQFKNLSTTIGYSHINFFDKGNINSNQIRVGLQIPLSFDYTNFANREKFYSVEKLKNSEWNQESNRISMMVHFNNLKPYGNSMFTDGSSLTGKTIQLAGFELASYFSKKWFSFFKVDGAYNGIRGGYMDIFLGGGYHLSINNNRTNILTKFGIGAGGGGGIDSAGGFFIYPDISIEQHIFDNIYLSVNKGYLMSPNQYFTSSSLGFGLKYYTHLNGILAKNNHLKNTLIKGIEFILGHEIYIDAKRIVAPTEDLYQIAFQANLYLTKTMYLAGHTSFANFGNAGAYAEGLVGLGYQSKPLINNKLQLFTQILAGAAGGGDISTGEGLIFKPSMGVNLMLNSKLHIRTSLGKVKAKGGSLNSTSITFGVNYRLSFLTAK